MAPATGTRAPRMFSSGTSDRQQNSLRSIAIVVDGLERNAADAMLERLPAELERSVRDLLIELDEVDETEREAASREFYTRMMGELGVEMHDSSNVAIGEDNVVSETTGALSPDEHVESASTASSLAVKVQSENEMIEDVIADAPECLAPPRSSRATTETDATEQVSHSFAVEKAVENAGAPPDEELFSSLDADTCGLAEAASIEVKEGGDGSNSLDESEHRTPKEWISGPSPDTGLVDVAADPISAERVALLTTDYSHVHDESTAIQPVIVDPGLSQISSVVFSLREVIETHAMDDLVAVLKRERPQVIALVMAAMLPTEAAKFIADWPPSEQGEILQRLAKTHRADPLIVETVREELSRQLAEFAVEAARGEEGRERVQAIVKAAHGSAKQNLLGGLADADRDLFRQVAVAADHAKRNTSAEGGVFDAHLAAVAFDRFVDLSDVGLEQVFSALDPDVAVLALAGASQPCLADVLDRLPRETSDDLRSRMECIGPLRLSDIQQAQLMAVAASHHILSQGESELDAPQHLKLIA